MINKLNIYSSDVGTSLISNRVEEIEAIRHHEFLKKYIPDVKIASNSNMETGTTIKLTTEISYIDFQNFPYVEINPINMTVIEIITLIELVLERARQEKGIYCIHASCSLYKNEAIVFWGDVSGMGKTTFAEKLSKVSGGEFYSDEKTLINLNTCSVVGGINYINRSKQTNDSDGYEKVGKSRNSEKRIRSLVYGLIEQTNNSRKIEWSPDKFEWHLYEELSRKIRASSRRVLNGSRSVPSLDTQDLADKRIKEVRNFIGKIKCYQLMGSPDQVISFLTS